MLISEQYSPPVSVCDTPFRIIARLDIKGDRLIKGVNLDGVRPIGDPRESAHLYYRQGCDELLLMDAVASLYGRNHLSGIIRWIAENVFVPITVGGGLRSLVDVNDVLRVGADKVAINTAAVANPELISEVAMTFGAQCMVLQIDAKRRESGKWEVWVDGGREPTGLDVLEWAQRGVELGAGEIVLTSIDHEGTRRGYEIDLCQAVTQAVPVPVIASGGMGAMEHLIEIIRVGGADAFAIADFLHVRETPVNRIKNELAAAGIAVRRV